MAKSEQTADTGRKIGLAPLLCGHPRLLILGSLPGDRSLELQEYYGHPQNRFWKVIAAVHGLPCPDGYGHKKEMLVRCRIALWDIYHAASRPGSMDADIRQAEFNDIAGLLDGFPEIRAVALNGSTAAKGFDRYVESSPVLSIGNAETPTEGNRSLVRIAERSLSVLRLPSTSPANARWTFGKLAGAWDVIGNVV